MIDEELSANVTQAWKDIFNKYVGYEGKKCVGPKRKVSYERLDKLTGIPETTLYKIQQGQHNPRSAEQAAILLHLPSGAFDRYAKVIGYGVHRVAGEGCAFEAAAASAEFQTHFHESIADDGHYDRMEHHRGFSIRERAIDALQRLHLMPPSRKYMPVQSNPFREASD